jgi:acetate kinase
MKVLVLNSGSSSQKSRLYEIGDPLPDDSPSPIWDARIEWRVDATAAIQVRTSSGEELSQRLQIESRQEATAFMLETLWSGRTRVVSDSAELAAVGHRIVNGGLDLHQPTPFTSTVKEKIEKASRFAPLHNRDELEGIQEVEKKFGSVPQIAVFDTGFHRTLPEQAIVYAGPYDWYQSGIRKIGFHGINHEYCAGRTAQLLKRKVEELRIISCHLGNGCSLAAIRAGKSVETTMGFTPLDGLVMGTRSGSIDPGVLTHLMAAKKSSAEEIDEILNKKSGLFGLSGVSSDMREILTAMRAGNVRAKLAFEVFVHRLRMGIGSMAAALGGTDVLVFTAGIGENSSEVRAATCEGLGFLGIELDETKNLNRQRDADISRNGSNVRVLVIAAQEDWAIARECFCLLRQRKSS